MEEVGIFYDLFVYFTDIWCILWPLCMYICWLVGIFSPVLVSIAETKSGNPGPTDQFFVARL
jgi:hypothetical protein